MDIFLLDLLNVWLKDRHIVVRQGCLLLVFMGDDVIQYQVIGH